MMRRFLFLWLLLQSPAPGFSAEKPGQVDFLALASLLLTDGHFGRAKNTLDSAGPEIKSEDPARFYTLLGLAERGLGDWEPARNHLRLAVESGATDPSLHVHLSQIAYQQKDYVDAVYEIEKTGDLLLRSPALWSMKAQSLWLLKRYKRTWDALDQAEAIFPQEASFLRRRVLYLVELGLFQHAVTVARRFVESASITAEDYLTLGNAFQSATQYHDAQIFLERARILYPADSKISQLLAHVYLKLGQLSTAASMMEEASLTNRALIPEAAQLYGRAGRFGQMLNLNAQIQDEEKKLKQRISIYLQLKHFELILNMEKDLQRVGLLDDQDILYAMAYSSFKAAQFERMETFLTGISRADLFRKGIELRKAATGCVDQPWLCLG